MRPAGVACLVACVLLAISNRARAWASASWRCARSFHAKISASACHGRKHANASCRAFDDALAFDLLAIHVAHIVLQELLAIQDNGPKQIAFFGTRNMGFLHQTLVETLAYAMVLTDNHIYTSGGLGTNAAVVRGALRAEKPDKLTVILPQSLEKQPEELHESLKQVQDLRCMTENNHMKLLDASRCCLLLVPAIEVDGTLAPCVPHSWLRHTSGTDASIDRA